MVLGVGAPQFPFDEALQSGLQYKPKAVAGQSMQKMADIIPQLIQMYKQETAKKQLAGLFNPQLPTGAQGPVQPPDPGKVISAMIEAGFDPATMMGGMFPSALQKSTIDKNEAEADWLRRRKPGGSSRPFNPASAAAVDVRVQQDNINNRPWWQKMFKKPPSVVNPMTGKPGSAAPPSADDYNVMSFQVDEDD